MGEPITKFSDNTDPENTAEVSVPGSMRNEGDLDSPEPKQIEIYAAIFDGNVKIENGELLIGDKYPLKILDELEKSLVEAEKKLEAKILRLIYELEDHLNITLRKS